MAGLLAASSVAERPVRSMPQCVGVTLSASYLAAVGSEQLPGFRFTLSNHTNHEIKLAEPVPSSAHWYARTHGRWLWRASNGAGGGLLNAGNERGRLVVYPAKSPANPKPGEPATLVVPPRQSRTWTSSQQQNDVLAYQPGCTQCSYPGERAYQVIFGYAYQSRALPGLLPCGLRSRPVPMPPKY